MQLFILSCCTVLLAACGRPAERAADDERASMDTAATATPAAPEISLADLAGKWKVRTTDESGGTPVEAEWLITSDTSGWTLTLPNRKPVPVRVVAVAGDSIVTEAGPFESAIRKGVQVRTRSVSRLRDGKLVGTTEATYATKSGDSVVQRIAEGTRVE